MAKRGGPIKRSHLYFNVKQIQYGICLHNDEEYNHVQAAKEDSDGRVRCRRQDNHLIQTQIRTNNSCRTNLLNTLSVNKSSF